MKTQNIQSIAVKALGIAIAVVLIGLIIYNIFAHGVNVHTFGY